MESGGREDEANTDEGDVEAADEWKENPPPALFCRDEEEEEREEEDEEAMVARLAIKRAAWCAGGDEKRDCPWNDEEEGGEGEGRALLP